MEQHAIPQHISSYQFRLVGDMTVRQFSFLAGGCIVGLLFYVTPLAPLIKWPLTIFSVFIGAAIAFLPIQERPLDKWIVAFIKAIFSPTQFVWKKQPKQPAIFKVAAKGKITRWAPAPPPDRKQLTEYLATLPTEPKSPLDEQEENFVKKALNMFQLAKMPMLAPQPTIGTPTQVPPIQPPIPQTPKPTPKPQPEMKPLQAKKAVPPIKTKPTAPLKKKRVVLPEKPTRAKKPKVEAKFSPTLPFPAPPSQPNTLVGMVLDREDKLIEGAIIEIRDNQSVPVRALKTNKLGQFRSVTPLDNGQYEIEIEKEGYQFDILKITLTGVVVEPLEIRAKRKTHEPAQNA